MNLQKIADEQKNSDNQKISVPSTTNSKDQTPLKELELMMNQSNIKAKELEFQQSLIMKDFQTLQNQLMTSKENLADTVNQVSEISKKMSLTNSAICEKMQSEVLKSLEKSQNSQNEIIGSLNSLIQNESEKISELKNSNENLSTVIETALIDLKAGVMGSVKQITSESINGSITDIRKATEQTVNSFKQTASRIVEREEKDISLTEELHQDIKKTAKSFNFCMLFSSLFALFSACVLVFGLYFATQYYQPISMLNASMDEIQSLSDHVTVINNQLDNYYRTATDGQNLNDNIFSARWENGDYGIALWMVFKQYYWLISILIYILLIACIVKSRR